jgi:phosphoribosylpyrophosphate synthetase
MPPVNPDVRNNLDFKNGWKGASEALENSVIEELIITDTVENQKVFKHPKVKVVTVAQLFAQAVKIIHNRDSLSQLFDNIGTCFD